MENTKSEEIKIKIIDMNKRPTGKIKWNLLEFECDNCEIGIVQIHEIYKRGVITTTISGCLDCKKEFGIKQAFNLKPIE